MFRNFWPKSAYLQILTKLTFLGNFDQNQDLGKILTQIDFTNDID